MGFYLFAQKNPSSVNAEIYKKRGQKKLNFDKVGVTKNVLERVTQ
jgi:hypothetical protein